MLKRFDYISVENLELNSMELKISRNSDKDLEIRGPEGRNLRFYFINCVFASDSVTSRR